MKKGISLIVLVITIIVMIILAGVIILSLSNSGIISKAEQAVEDTNLSEVQHLATLAWSEEYMNQQEAGGTINLYDLKDVVDTALGELKDKYNVEVTLKGVTVRRLTDSYEYKPQITAVPDAWKENVTQVVDGVPIPKGFVVSPYGTVDPVKGTKAENNASNGLVIYELKDGETVIDTTKETQFESWTTRNQFVWVPVDKDKFDTQFVRKDFDTNTVIENISEPLSYKLHEPHPEMTGLDDTTLTEVTEMYESIKEYGGFYIARYEAGIDEQRKEGETYTETPGLTEGTKMYSMMGKIPYTFLGDADTKKVARNLYPNDDTKNTTGVVSTLIYGAQWDRTLQWFIDTKAMTLDEVNTTVGSGAYGRYSGVSITKDGFNLGARIAEYIIEEVYESGDLDMIIESLGDYIEVQYDANGNWSVPEDKDMGTFTTGALKVAKINNIYDMAGNVVEMTMEKMAGYACRGGAFLDTGKQSPISKRWGAETIVDAYRVQGLESFRPALYIKK